MARKQTAAYVREYDALLGYGPRPKRTPRRVHVHGAS